MKKALFSLFIALIFVGCSKSGEDKIDEIIPPKIIPIESIDLGIDTIDLKIGESYKFEYSIFPSNTTDSTYKVALKSLDDKVVILKDDLFTIQSLGIGSTCVVAYLSTNEKITDTCVINVLPIKEEKIEMSETESYMIVGDEITLTAQVYPQNTTFKEINWSSSDEKIATVDNGIVRALSEGEVFIFAESKNGLKTECKILIENIHVDKVSITSGINNMYMVGDIVQLSYSVYPDNAFNKNVKITSYNESVVKIDDDFKLHAISKGEATIIIESEDGYALTMYEVKVGDILSFVKLNTSGVYSIMFGKVNGEVYCQLFNNSKGTIKITAFRIEDDYGNILMTAYNDTLGSIGAMQSSLLLGGKFNDVYYPKFIWNFEYNNESYEIIRDLVRDQHWLD